MDVSYSQTGRTGTSATYRVSVAVYFTSTGWYGYGMNGKVTINGVSKEIRFKNPSPSWNGSGHKGTWNFDITASAGSNGGTLPANVRVWGTDGDGTVMDTGSKTVSLSTWNTAPTWTGNGNVNGWTSSTIMAENTGKVTVNFPPASDKEGNTLRYDVWRYINGSSNSKIATGSTARSLTDNLSGFGQGTKVKYLFKVSDGSLWASGDKWTVEHSKNTFTPATIKASGGIGYSTSSITLTVSGAKNTNGNKDFGYRLYSPDGLTVFNDSFTPNSSGQVTLSVYNGSGTRPSNPHIDFSQLKSFVAKGTYRGTLVLRLQTSNIYGSSGSKEVAISVDLRTNPVPASLGNPTGAVTVAGGSYFVHNLSTVKVTWSGASDRLGAGALSYELQYKYGNGSWTRLTTTTGTSWSGKLGAVSSATTCYFRVITTTTYGYSATSGEKSITMHYYNSPKVSYRSPNRTVSEFTVYIDSSTDTSISAVAISKRTFIGLNGTAKDFAGSSTLIKDTGLNGDSNYNLTVKVTDNSGLSNATRTITVPVKTYIPILSITNKGIAINTTANPAYKLTIGGSMSVAGNLRIVDVDNNFSGTSGIYTYKGNDVNGMGMAIQSGGAMVIGSGESPINFIGTIANKSEEVTYITSDSAIHFVANCQTLANKKTASLYGDGTFNAPNIQVGGNNVYHTGRKPTKDDLFAVGGTGLHCSTKVDDAKYIWKSGFYDIDVGAGGKNVPFGGWNWLIHSSHTNNNSGLRYGMQIAGQNGTNNFAIRTINQYGDGTWNTLYHTGNKPKASDVGALPLSGGTLTGAMTTNSNLTAKGGVLYLGQGAKSSWVGFYDSTGTRRGYIGKGSPDSNLIYLSADTEKTIVTIGHFSPSATKTYWLGTNSPDRKWKGLCAEGGTVGASDVRSKENIERLDGTIVSYDEVTSEIKEYELSHFRSNVRAVGSDYYEFIRDRFKPSYYNYKLSEQVIADTGEYVIAPEDEYNMLKNVGFIAQDYDLKNDKVAQEFIFEGGDGELAYNHMSYVTVGMIALQEATRKIDALEEENRALKDRLSVIEEKLGIA